MSAWFDNDSNSEVTPQETAPEESKVDTSALDSFSVAMSEGAYSTEATYSAGDYGPESAKVEENAPVVNDPFEDIDPPGTPAVYDPTLPTVGQPFSAETGVAVSQTVEALKTPETSVDVFPRDLIGAETCYNRLATPSKDAADLEVIAEKIALATMSKTKLTKENIDTLAANEAEEYTERKAVFDMYMKSLQETLMTQPRLDMGGCYARLEDKVYVVPENPTTMDLMTGVARVQNLMDACMRDYEELIKVDYSYKQLIDAAVEMWCAVSLESSDTTRKGEAKLFLHPLIIMSEQYSALRKTYESTIRRLEKAYDTMSRQITVMQIRAGLQEIARPEGFDF